MICGKCISKLTPEQKQNLNNVPVKYGYNEFKCTECGMTIIATVKQLNGQMDVKERILG